MKHVQLCTVGGVVLLEPTALYHATLYCMAQFDLHLRWACRPGGISLALPNCETVMAER